MILLNFSSGSCTVSPPVGVVLTTKFNISCNGWQDEHQPLRYKFYQIKNGVSLPLCESFLSECSVSLPIGDPARNFSLNVFTLVNDTFGGTVLSNHTITVSLALLRRPYKITRNWCSSQSLKMALSAKTNIDLFIYKK